MMEQFDEQHKIALISCIEVVLMSMGNTKYNMVIAKLNVYNITMRDSYKNLEELKTVLKEVYAFEYNQVINEIKIQLGDLSNEKDIAEFFKVMES
jgi:hypothetical protein